MPEKMNLNQERDLVTVECCQCVRDLLGSPVLQKHMNYKPERVYGDDDRKSAVFDEILGCTANWWDTVTGNLFLAQKISYAYQLYEKVADRI